MIVEYESIFSRDGATKDTKAILRCEVDLRLRAGDAIRYTDYEIGTDGLIEKVIYISPEHRAAVVMWDTEGDSITARLSDGSIVQIGLDEMVYAVLGNDKRHRKALETRRKNLNALKSSYAIEELTE